MRAELISHELVLPSVAGAAMAGGDDRRYTRRPADAVEWASRAREVMTRVGQSALADLAPAFEAGGRAAERLARSAGGKGIVVTTGQQPGLFGGPVYTLSKALSALALADELEAATGIPVAPVFWAATDDSDFREASRIAVAVSGGATEIAIEAGVPVGPPMSRMPIGETHAQLRELAGASGSGPGEDFLALVRESYAAGGTIGQAYVKLLRLILEPLGIGVLDASHEAVRLAAAPSIRRALDLGGDIAAAISENNAEIEAAGHPLQVQEVPGLSLVFESTREGRKRVPLKRAHKGAGAGADLGPNVLLRPVVESSILPTVAYVGGPAEIAYFAQLSPIAAVLGVARPLIVPRWSVTIVEPHVREILDSLNAEPQQLKDPHAMEAHAARETIPPALTTGVDDLRQAIETRAVTLKGALGESGLGLADSVAEGTRRTLLHRVDRLERRIVAAAKRKNLKLMHDIATARGSLFPLGRPQERALSFVPFLVRGGQELLDAMLSEAGRHARSLAARTAKS